jgi:glucokinase
MRVVLGAGTGMGVAWLTWQGNCYIPHSTEAGHVDFAPTNALQDDFLEFQRKKFGHVSIERVLSGSGLADTFNFLQTSLNKNSQLIQTNISVNNSLMVTDLALNRKHPIAMKALNLFIEIYGAYAGNLALTGLCHGGIYVAGGIAPKIIDKLKEGNFIKSFCNKGRYSNMMKSFPVHVVLNPNIGVLGAMQEIQRMKSCKS